MNEYERNKRHWLEPDQRSKNFVVQGGMAALIILLMSVALIALFLLRAVLIGVVIFFGWMLFNVLGIVSPPDFGVSVLAGLVLVILASLLT